MDEDNARIKGVKKTVITVVYLLMALLVCGLISRLCRADTAVVKAFKPGITDLRQFDFKNRIAQIAGSESRSVYIYSGKLYSSSDFLNADTAASGVLYGVPPDEMGDFGTLRMEVMLPPGNVYAIAAKNASYAQRLFIDGREYTPVGTVGSRTETVVPKTVRFSEGFMPERGTTEIIIHYSNFVHSDDGGLYPVDIGFVGNIVRSEQLKIFRIAAVSTALAAAMILFIGLFFLFPKNTHLLWFGLLCGCISVRSLFVGSKPIMTMLPDLNWYTAIRIEYLITSGAVVLTGLYLWGLFPGKLRRNIAAACAAAGILAALFICLTPPIIFTEHFKWAIALCSIPALGILISVFYDAARNRLISQLSWTERRLLFAGLIFYTALSLMNFFTHGLPLLLFGLEYSEAGTLLLLLINMLVLILGFYRTERELDTAKARECEIVEVNRMLERMNRIKTEFLAGISHEMKTPLTVISNNAELARMKYQADVIDAEAESSLFDIAEEAQRLGRLVDQLLHASAGKQDFGPISATDILRLGETAAPILAQNKNRLKIEDPGSLPNVLANRDLIEQVLMNLITNANRHCEGQEIELSAYMYGNEFVQFTLRDRGSGISPELLPHIFDWGKSGDGGTGCGLAIARDVIETHGGSIEADSIQGMGTDILFTLPVYKGGAK